MGIIVLLWCFLLVEKGRVKGFGAVGRREEEEGGVAGRGKGYS